MTVLDGQPGSLRRVRVELATRLRERHSEIEAEVLNRIDALEMNSGREDREYESGLREALAAVIDLAIDSIESDDGAPRKLPPAAAVQARRAARYGTSLDTVLRRYAAGDRLLGEIVMTESDQFPGEVLGAIVRSNAPQIDILMAAVADEYQAEVERIQRSPAERLGERVQRLLAGSGNAGLEPIGYTLEGRWHLGLILVGAEALDAGKLLADRVGAEVLTVPRGSDIVWAWIGAADLEDLDGLDSQIQALPPEVSLAIGGTHRGVDGWRLTHKEAQAAYEVMLRRPRRVTRCSDVVLLAAVLRDDVLANNLLRTFLAPLDERGDSGRILRETLRAYFAAGHNAATAAAALGVDRHTVQRRLRKTEDLLGRLLHSCYPELEVALELEEIGSLPRPGGEIPVPA